MREILINHPVIADLMFAIFGILMIVKGYKRGLILSLLGLVGFAAGYFFGIKFLPQFFDLIPALPKESILRSGYSMAFLFVFSLITNRIVLFIGKRIRKLFIFAPIRWIDSLLGALLSATFAILTLWIVYVVGVATLPSDWKLIIQSSEILTKIHLYTPQIFENLIADQMNRIRVN